MNATVASAPVHDAATVSQLLGIALTADQIASFGPPPEPLDGYVTFFDPGWSVVQLRAAVKERGRILFPHTWYDDELFAKAEDGPRYRQVRMGPVPGSTRKSFDEQVALLPNDEEIPSARVVVAALVIHFLATNQRLLPDVYVRCSDQISGGSRVCVGLFDSGGLVVGDGWGVDRNDFLGLASSRKFP